MAVNSPKPIAADLKAVAGIDIGVAEAGIKKANRKDLLLLALAPTATVSGVFTLNRFCAAPVQLAKADTATAATAAAPAAPAAVSKPETRSDIKPDDKKSPASK